MGVNWAVTTAAAFARKCHESVTGHWLESYKPDKLVVYSLAEAAPLTSAF